MLNRIQKAYRTAVDTYRLTRFRQKAENTAFGLARRYGIELKDAVWIRDNAPELAESIVIVMRKFNIDAQLASDSLVSLTQTCNRLHESGLTREQVALLMGIGEHK